MLGRNTETNTHPALVHYCQGPSAVTCLLMSRRLTLPMTAEERMYRLHYYNRTLQVPEFIHDIVRNTEHTRLQFFSRVEFSFFHPPMNTSSLR